MSADLVFSNRRRPGQFLYRFLSGGHELLAAESARRLRPLIEFLAGLHRSGLTHGAVTPGRLLLSEEGEWDLDFFKIRAGSPDPLEQDIYYPNGPGGSFEERRQSDVRALAAVLHLIIADYPPARPRRRVSGLAAHPLASAWPAALIDWVDRVLETPPGNPASTLKEIAAALPHEPPTPHAGPDLEVSRLQKAALHEEASAPSPDSLGIEVVEVGEKSPAKPDLPPMPPPVPEPTPVPTMPEVSALKAAPVLNPPQDLLDTPAAAKPSKRLPNAMAGRPFAVDLSTLEEFAATEDSNFQIAPSSPEIPTALPPGLRLSGSLLTGIPDQPGEHEIPLLIADPSSPLCPSGASSDAVPCRQVLLLLTINADPRSLWKNLPSDPSGPFIKADTASLCLTTLPSHAENSAALPRAGSGSPAASLTILGASLRGRSHAHIGAYRDDDMTMAWFPEQAWAILAVADGAGSAKFSREGSRLACQEIVAFFSQSLGQHSAVPENVIPVTQPAAATATTGQPAPAPPLHQTSLTSLAEAHARAPEDSALYTALSEALAEQFHQAVSRARKAIEAAAAAHRAEPRDFHTTLITVLLRPLADGRWFAAVFSIGDGAAAVIGAPGGTPCLLTKADSGDYAGQTVFLTMDQAMTNPASLADRIQTAILPSFEAIALVTDGVSDPLFPSDTALADPAQWTRLWQEDLQPILSQNRTPEAQAKALLDWLTFHSPGHHDDRTILLASPCPDL